MLRGPPTDIANLPRYTAYVRLLVDGMPTQPFSMETLPPVPPSEDRSAIVTRVSNQRYARRSPEVADCIGKEIAGH